MGDEGERGDFGGLQPVADGDLEFGARRGVAGGTKPSAMARLSEGAKPPEVTRPMPVPCCIEDVGAFAGRGALDEEADADAAEVAGEFGEDARGAGEVARPRGGAC